MPSQPAFTARGLLALMGSNPPVLEFIEALGILAKMGFVWIPEQDSLAV
jgi:hypothetical protein